jgi:hypothetical protein
MGMYYKCEDGLDLLEVLAELRNKGIKFGGLQVLVSSDEEGNSFCSGIDVGLEKNVKIDGTTYDVVLVAYPSGMMVDAEFTDDE